MMRLLEQVHDAVDLVLAVVVKVLVRCLAIHRELLELLELALEKVLMLMMLLESVLMVLALEEVLMVLASPKQELEFEVLTWQHCLVVCLHLQVPCQIG